MNTTLNRASMVFAAGCLGGVVINAVNIVFGIWDFPAMIGVDILQDANLAHLYLDLFWGGLWGFLFLIPVLNNLYLLKGAVLSIIPTLTQIFLIVPSKAGLHLLEGQYGMMELFYIFVLNLIWGIVAAAFLKFARVD